MGGRVRGLCQVNCSLFPSSKVYWMMYGVDESGKYHMERAEWLTKGKGRTDRDLPFRCVGQIIKDISFPCIVYITTLTIIHPSFLPFILPYNHSSVQGKLDYLADGH